MHHHESVEHTEGPHFPHFCLVFSFKKRSWEDSGDSGDIYEAPNSPLNCFKMTQPAKKQKVKKQLILSAATRGTATNNWRDPKDTSRDFANSLQPWIDFAQWAEKGKFQSIFFIDHLTWFDVYGGDYKAAAKHGINASRIDPSAPITAIALATKNIGITSTFSTASEHPYHFARRLASLDHLTGGRVAWNIVSSYLPSVGKNLLDGKPLPEHDERYNRAREYLDAVYALLVSSWRDDALVYDAERGVFADPDLIREVHHKGKYFNFPGPAITEPSPQRIPLIAQAGSSAKGIDFGAENAELIYTLGFDIKATKKAVADVRRIAKERYGRDPHSIKFIAPATPFLGQTSEQAWEKFREYEEYGDPVDQLIYFGGASGIDTSPFGFDEPVVTDGKSDGVQSTTRDVLGKPGSNKTPRQIAEAWKKNTQLVGTGAQVAAQIQKFVQETDVDGINFNFHAYPSGIKDVVELLVPELQRLGLHQTEYPVEGGTFRENFYGEQGHTFVPESHPAYKLRWTSDLSQKEFEAQLAKAYKVRDNKRAEANL